MAAHFQDFRFHVWFLAPKDVSYFPKSLALQLKEWCILSSSTVCFITGVFKLFPRNVNLMQAWAKTKPCYGLTVNMCAEDTCAEGLAASRWALERLLTPEFSDFTGGFINGLSHGQCTTGRWGPARGLGSLELTLEGCILFPALSFRLSSSASCLSQERPLLCHALPP